MPEYMPPTRVTAIRCIQDIEFEKPGQRVVTDLYGRRVQYCNASSQNIRFCEFHGEQIKIPEDGNSCLTRIVNTCRR